MNRSRAIRYAAGGAIVVLVALLAPPATVFISRVWFIHRAAEKHWGPNALSTELYRSFIAWDTRQSGYPPEAMRIYPYLGCNDPSPASLPSTEDYKQAKQGHWSPAIGNSIFMDALISANILDQDAGYARLLRERYSTTEMAALIACIQASVFASKCGETIRDATYGNNDRLEAERDPTSSDALRAKSVCLYFPAVTAYLRQSAEGSKK